MKKIFSRLALISIVVASSWALLHDHFFRVHDYVHAARVIEMFRALDDGQFPVLWSENFGYGYGMPLFEFYAPLPYFCGAIFHWFGFSVLSAVKILFLLSAIFTTWGAYLLGSKIMGRTAGVLTAAAITLAPYRAVNLFVRGALSEAWGIMAMPWVLLGIIKVVHQEKGGWKILTFSLVVLMLSHNIMTLLFVPLALVFAVLYLGYRKWVVHKNRNSELKTLLKISGALLLATGLSSFYLFPALLEKDFTKVGDIFAGYFHYSHHFLYIRQFFQLNWGYEGSAWGPDDGISFFLGWGQWLGFGITGLLILIRIIKNKRFVKIINDKKLVLSAILASLFGLSLFLAILKSKSLWDTLPGLSFAQFPWRFLGVGIIFLGLIVGMSANLIKSKGLRYLWTFVLLIIILFNAKLFKPKEYLTDANDFYYTETDLIQREMSGILPDYIPIQMAKDLTPPAVFAWCETDCKDQIEVLIDRSHENLIKTNFIQEQTVEFAVADFPGWEVELDGKKVDHQQAEKGNIALSVPAGEHQIGLLFTQTPLRLFFDLVSLISLLFVIFLTIDIKDNPNTGLL